MTEETSQRSGAANYHSYLFRLWRYDGQAPWQASLQSTATGQIIHFATLDQLWTFLQTQLGLKADKS